MRSRIAETCRFVCKILGWIGIALVSVLAFPIAYEAIARFFGHPTIWVFETSLYALIAAAFLANGIALSSGAHFRITFLGQVFPWARKGLDRIALWITLIFAGALTYASSRFVIYSVEFDIRSNSLLSVPQFLPQLALPIGAAALALQTIAFLLRDEMPGEVTGEALEAMPGGER